MSKFACATALSAGAAVSVVLCGTARADFIDLTAFGAAAATANGGIVLQGNGGGSAGSGTFPFIYKIQTNSEGEAGVNDPDKPLETKDVSSPGLRLSGLVSAGDYYEFALDVNENTNSIIFLDSVQIYLSASANPVDITAGDTAPYSSLGTLIYDLGPKSVKLDAAGTGSGKADMLLYVPKSLFTLPSVADPYVYLYSRFSGNDAGFEEWGLRDSNSTPPDPGTFLPPSVPVPAAIWGGAGLLGLLGAVKGCRRRGE